MRIKFTHAIFDTYDPEFHGVQGHAYSNKCEHRQHEFLGCVKQIEPDRSDGAIFDPDNAVMVVKKYDVYVHEGDLGGANVCIRYGDEGHEYVSPGTVLDFLASENNRSRWPAVCALLVAKLDFFCERRP